MGTCCQSQGTVRQEKQTTEKIGKKPVVQVEAQYGPPEEDADMDDYVAPSKSEGDEPAVLQSAIGKENKEKLVDDFLTKKRYSLEHGFASQTVLAAIIKDVCRPLEKALLEYIFENNSGASMWSNKHFEAELAVVVDAVEQIVIPQHIDMKRLVELAISIETSKEKLTADQKVMLKNIVCNGVLSKEFTGVDVSKDALFKSVATELLKKLRHEAEYYSDPQPGDLKALIKYSQKQALRRINLKYYSTTYIVQHYNLIVTSCSHFKKERNARFIQSVKVEARKDSDDDSAEGDDDPFALATGERIDVTKFAKSVFVDLKSKSIQAMRTLEAKDFENEERLAYLAMAILDVYKDSENTSDFDDNCVREVIALAGMNHPKVYRRLLEQLIHDIENDHLLHPEKLKYMAAVLIHLAEKDACEASEYCSAQDLNACLQLLSNKFDKILLSDDNDSVHQIYDALNIVLTMMAQMRASGLKKEDAEALADKISKFQKADKTALARIMAGGEEQCEKGSFSLRVKTDYGLEALNRIGGTQKEDQDDQFLQLSLGVMGAAGLLKGIATMDTEALSASLQNFKHMKAMQAPKSQKWWEIVQHIRMIAGIDFTLFKNQYLGGNQQKNTRKAFQSLKKEDIERIVFYVIEIIEEKARDRGAEYEERVFCVDCLYSMHFKNGREAPGLMNINWYHRSLNLKYYIRECLARLGNLLPEGFGKTKLEIGEKAKNLMTELAKYIPKEEFRQMEDAGRTMFPKFADKPPCESNKSTLMALNEKMPVENFLASLKIKGEEEYKLDVKGLCLIDISGFEYLNSKAVMAHEKRGKYTLPENEQSECYTEIYRYFAEKRKQNAKDSGQPQAGEAKIDSKAEPAPKEGEDEEQAEHVLLYEGLPLFLNSDRSAVMLIQGDAGTGKSIFLKVVEHQIWKAFERGHTPFVPIFIRLSEVLNPSNAIEELMRNQFSNRHAYQAMKNSSGHFLFLLDGYDELKAPKNMYIQNKLVDWKGTVKMIMSSRQEYLSAYGNYEKYFRPKYAEPDVSTLMEYRISEVSQEQRTVYITKRIQGDLNRIAKMDKVADKDMIDLLGEWVVLERYEREISNIKGLDELIKTPYMLTIIINVLPELQKQKTSDKEGVTKSVIYKAFTKQYFIAQAARLQSNEGESLPKGYDLEASFYNYSMDLAVEMWVQDKTSVPAIEYNYSYPARVKAENKFEKFFKEKKAGDDKVRLARAGAQLILMDGKARFTHKSIMEYFAARVIYEQIKYYDKPTKKDDLSTGSDLAQDFLHDKLLKGQDKTDSESDVLSFVLDMIKFNYIKQSEMKIDDDEGQLESVDAYDKIKTILKGFNKECLTVEGKLYSIQYLTSATTWKHNALIIACHFPDLIKVLDDDIRTAVYWSREVAYGVRNLMLHKAIAQADEEKDTAEVDRLCLIHIARHLDGTNYTGQYFRNGEIIKAHGKGVLTKDSNKYEGEFKDGEQVTTGQIKITYENHDVYTGEWKDGRKNGYGVMDYYNESKYEGTWEEDKRHGKCKITQLFGRYFEGECEKGKIKDGGALHNCMGNPRGVLFDTNNLTRWQEGCRALKNGASVTKDENVYMFSRKAYAQWNSTNFDYTRKPTGLPVENFEISFEFRTYLRDAGLFCLYSSASNTGVDYCRTVMLRKGVVHLRLCPTHNNEKEEFKPHQVKGVPAKNYSDAMWHSCQLTVRGKKVQLYMDAELVGTKILLEKEQFNSQISMIVLGYCGVHKMRPLEGQMRNLVIKEFDDSKARDLEFNYLNYIPAEGEEPDVAKTDGIKGRMRCQMKESKGSRHFNEEVYEFKGTLGPKGFKFDPAAAAKIVVDWWAANKADPRIQTLLAEIQTNKQEGEFMKMIWDLGRVQRLKTVEELEELQIKYAASFEEAKEAVKTIEKSEILGLANPGYEMKCIMGAVITLASCHIKPSENEENDENENNKSDVPGVLENPEAFIEFLTKFDVSSIGEETVKALGRQWIPMGKLGLPDNADPLENEALNNNETHRKITQWATATRKYYFIVCNIAWKKVYDIKQEEKKVAEEEKKRIEEEKKAEELKKKEDEERAAAEKEANKTEAERQAEAAEKAEKERIALEEQKAAEALEAKKTPAERKLEQEEKEYRRKREKEAEERKLREEADQKRRTRTAKDLAAEVDEIDPQDGAGGWECVRHVPHGQKWHPATDRLTGSQEAIGDSSAQDQPWSVKFDDKIFNQMLLVTGDLQKWMIIDKNDVLQKNYEYELQPIWRSSLAMKDISEAKMHNRAGAEGDPFLSLTDYDNAKEEGLILYAEASQEGKEASEILPKHDGANVFIRKFDYTSEFVPKEYADEIPGVFDHFRLEAYKNSRTKICKLTLSSHRDKAIVRDAKASENQNYSGRPKSIYGLGSERDALWVMFDFVDTGMLIKEFFDLGYTWHNTRNEHGEGGEIVGTWCPPLSSRDDEVSQYRLYHIMPDKTIATVRSGATVFVGWNPNNPPQGGGEANPLTNVKKDSPLKLVFKDIEYQHQIKGPVVSLELSSHPGKAIVWDDEDNPPRAESYGYKRNITIGDAKDAIEVFMDADKRFCYKDMPFMVLDSQDTTRRPNFYSKHMGYNGKQQCYIVHEDNTVSLKEHPEKFLGADKEGKKLEYVKEWSASILKFKNIHILTQTSSAMSSLKSNLLKLLGAKKSNLQEEQMENQLKDLQSKLQSRKLALGALAGQSGDDNALEQMQAHIKETLALGIGETFKKARLKEFRKQKAEQAKKEKEEEDKLEETKEERAKAKEKDLKAKEKRKEKGRKDDLARERKEKEEKEKRERLAKEAEEKKKKQEEDLKKADAARKQRIADAQAARGRR